MIRLRWPLPPRPSTRALIREARRARAYSFFDFVHGYVYARWTYTYIGIGTGEHRLARAYKRAASWLGRIIPPRPAPTAAGGSISFADTYHGKVVTLESAARLVTVNQDINLGDLEHVIPYNLARDIILKHPDHIVALECPCRASRPNPCLPLDVCLIIGEPFASFINEHHAGRSRPITQGEAVDILRAEHERGHVHHAFFKDAMLGRFYAICNCCACCCGAMQAARLGVPMLASSGYVSQADPDLCAGCAACEAACQFGAISMADDRSVVDAGLCMGCGVCPDKCPNGAMQLVRDEAKGIPLEIDVLMAQAAGGGA